MLKRLSERLRGARRIEWFAALALAALLALLLIGADHGGVSRAGTPLEARVERILRRIEGTGRVSVMITQGEDGVVTGAVVVADGLSDMQTYLRLQKAVSALLDLGPDRIEIIGGSFGGGP